jgi:glutamine amidotransferase
MSRLFGYIANEAERVRCALFPVRESLTAPVSAGAGGQGLGFYQSGEVLLQKRPRNQPGVADFYAQLRGLRTDMAIGYVREHEPAKSPASDNPYRFRSWLFAATSLVPHFAERRAELLESVPEFLRRNIRGQSEAEHLFYLFLAFLHDSGKLDDPNLAPADAAAAARATSAFAGRLAQNEPCCVNLMASNGRILVALGHGRPLAIFETRGIADCPLCREREPDDKRVAHEHLRSVLVVSNGEPEPAPGFEVTPDNTVVTVSHTIELVKQSF